MAEIVVHGSIVDWSIIITVRNIHTGILLRKVAFKKLTELRSYFFKHPRVAQELDYVIEKFKRQRVRSLYNDGYTVKLTLEYYDNISHNVHEFINVNHLVDVLRRQPALAKVVGYVRKTL